MKPSDEKTIFGFWVYIMTDCVLFASLFASFVVLRNNSLAAHLSNELFSLPFALTETLILLTSSFVCGLAILAALRGKRRMTMILLAITFLLGIAFLSLEFSEFSQLVQEGNSWRRNGFLSGFFTLVGTHGLHITAGLTWMAVMMYQISQHGLNRQNLRRLTMLSIFWHFLDVVWIFIFSIVYLMGAA